MNSKVMSKCSFQLSKTTKGMLHIIFLQNLLPTTPNTTISLNTN